MRIEITPPLETRHKVGIGLMILAMALAVGLINYALAVEEQKASARWQETHHGRP